MNPQIFPSVQKLAEHAAQIIVKEAHKAKYDHGYFSIALSGGSTPKKLYEILTSEDYKDHIDWEVVHFFMSDERFVSHDDERSNQKLAEDYLLSKLPVDRTKVHVVHTHLASPDVSAEAYEQEVRRVLGTADGAVPQFDMILLGIGSDGHTASLFPGNPALNEQTRLVIGSAPGILPPPVERVTFTYPLINQAKAVIFMAAGADKAPTIKQITADYGMPITDETTPSARVRPVSGELIWLIDQAAAGQSA